MAEDMLCRKFNSLVIKKIRDVDTLVLSSTWSPAARQGIRQAAYAEYRTRLQETIEAVLPYVKQIILLGPTPRLPDTIPRCIRTSSLDDCTVSRSEFDARTSQSRKLLASMAMTYDMVTYVDPADFFCTPEICPAFKDGYGLYWDSHHVSSTAARNFASGYLDKI